MAEALTTINPQDVFAQYLGACRNGDKLFSDACLNVLRDAGYDFHDALPWVIRKRANHDGLIELVGNLAVSITDRDPALRKRMVTALEKRSFLVRLDPVAFERTDSKGIPRPQPEPGPYMTPGAHAFQRMQQRAAAR